MKIIAGLGNPGPKYETTRHNAGFLAIDRLVARWDASGPVNKNEAEIFSTNYLGDKILLVKPQTYMNLSGRSLAPIFNFNKCKPEDLIVIHDELDLPPMALRVKTGGGAGGHNGIKSIDENLGRDQVGYHRVRIGVGHPSRAEEPQVRRLSPADYVLQPFTDDELAGLDPLLDDVAEAVEMILKGEMTAAQNKFHTSRG